MPKLHIHRQLSRLCDRFRYKRILYRKLLQQIVEIGDHILHITEHVHQCSFYRIRTMQYYNEIMRCLETVADECATMRDKILLSGVLRLTYTVYTSYQTRMGKIMDNLRYIYRVQGAKQFKHLLNIEFGSSIQMGWWHSFLDTAFIPLSYTVYSIRKNGEIKAHRLDNLFHKSQLLRFETSHDPTQIDTERILKILESHTLDNLCYMLHKTNAVTTSIFPDTDPKTNPATTATNKPFPSSNIPTDSNLSLIEHINGARVYVQVQSNYFVVLSGYFRNDSFQMMSNHTQLTRKRTQLHNLIQNNSVIPDAFTFGWTQQLSLRDQLVYNVNELNDHCIRSFQKLQELKCKTISTLVKDFLSSPLHVQRDVLTLFLLTEHDSDTQYLAYLMYDMISQESYLLKPQPLAEEIYNHLHWMVRKRFRVVIENISQYKKQLSNFTETNINYESRILLLKACDSVKKKAMEKLKEVQSKNGNDTNHKAQQYLDGILRVPFGIYQREYMFSFLSKFRERLYIYCTQYCSSIQNANNTLFLLHEQMKHDKQTITFHKIDNFLSDATEQQMETTFCETDKLVLLQGYWDQCTGTQIHKYVTLLKKRVGQPKLIYEYKQKKRHVQLKHKVDQKMVFLPKESIANTLYMYCKYAQQHNATAWGAILTTLPDNSVSKEHKIHTQLDKQLSVFHKEWISFKDETKMYMNNVDDILAKSVYGHAKAKRSIKQVIAQWITGELKGYCFGFEGPPGTGKTSLAKNGISKCLVDINGEKRPFAFIALGGSSNGSTLEGHSYTYVGSTWGRIVDILMESECMNPIIYIDELDKISRTEHGRELIGILTHMTDSTQNSEFMDKYFAGIRIDLSRVLFIFSYNDPDLLDPILRDRIHVVKFSPLKQADKHEVCKLHLIPEILRTIGLSTGDIVFPPDVIDYIIDNYTAEGGVRRLKEKLFEISRDLNIRHMVDQDDYQFPYTVSTDFLKNDLFVEHPILHTKCILNQPRVGLVNGMYASSLGVGGITIIECFVVPKSSFLALELTGKQGDVMKESMSVAKTVAWNLLTDATKNDLYAKSKENSFGLHIHCPDGGTPKDGPSAGTAITICILSSLLGLAVDNTVAITGEIDLNGQVCQIGGLDTKIRGAKKAGVQKVLFPKTNAHDLQSIKKHYSPFADDTLQYVMVETIWDVLPHVFTTDKYPFQTF